MQTHAAATAPPSTNTLEAIAMNFYSLMDEHTHLEKPKCAGLYLRLLHGRLDPDQDMNEFGFDGPYIGPLKSAHFTYCSRVSLIFADGVGTGPLPEEIICFKGDLLRFGGVYYGDFELTMVEG